MSRIWSLEWDRIAHYLDFKSLCSLRLCCKEMEKWVSKGLKSEAKAGKKSETKAKFGEFSFLQYFADEKELIFIVSKVLESNSKVSRELKVLNSNSSTLSWSKQVVERVLDCKEPFSLKNPKLSQMFERFESVLQIIFCRVDDTLASKRLLKLWMDSIGEARQSNSVEEFNVQYRKDWDQQETARRLRLSKAGGAAKKTYTGQVALQMNQKNSLRLQQDLWNEILTCLNLKDILKMRLVNRAFKAMTGKTMQRQVLLLRESGAQKQSEARSLCANLGSIEPVLEQWQKQMNAFVRKSRSSYTSYFRQEIQMFRAFKNPPPAILHMISSMGFLFYDSSPTLSKVQKIDWRLILYKEGQEIWNKVCAEFFRGKIYLSDSILNFKHLQDDSQRLQILQNWEFIYDYYLKNHPDERLLMCTSVGEYWNRVIKFNYHSLKLIVANPDFEPKKFFFDQIDWEDYFQRSKQLENVISILDIKTP